MIERTRRAASAAAPATSARTLSRERAAIAGTHGTEPAAPAASASHNSGVRYQRTVYSVGSATVNPAIAFRNAIAPVSVSARKNTQPIMTTVIVYTCGQIGHEATGAAIRRRGPDDSLTT